ncbi:MAG: oligosaccharide flippase family protein [Candidatus Hydrogenedentes bacterium]|nr:oligosaccharide flippase family protein [Candidatus Hydrogenedentota bacterium]
MTEQVEAAKGTEQEGDDNNKFLSRELVGSIPWAIGSRFVLFFVYLLASVVIVRGLGKESYGVYRLCTNIAEYLLIICCLGLNTALMRFVPELRVMKSKAGLTRLLTKTALSQVAMLLPVGLLLYALKPYLDDWLFKGNSHFLLLFTMVVLAGRLGRTFSEDVLTALFRMRAVSILAVVYGVLWLGVTVVALKYYPSPHTALLSQAGALFFVAIWGAIVLIKLLRGLDWTESTEGIGMRRVLGIALPRQLNQAASLITQQYSEIFFIGYFFVPGTVAIYEMGNWLPFVLITFLPMAVHKLFTSGFAEAYSRNPDCLGRLVTSYYKALILLVIPVSAFGAFFATDAIRVLYGEEMIEAGPVASAFFIIHLLPLISIPLGVALVTKEKILHMQPLLIMMIVVNLTFDWIFISRYGVVGACIAIVATFALTIPIRLYVVSRLIGGIYFPLRFFLKLLGLLLGLAFLFSLLVSSPGFVVLAALTIAYLVTYVALLRGLRLIHPDDIAEIREMGFTRLNRVLDALVVRKKS